MNFSTRGAAALSIRVAGHPLLDPGRGTNETGLMGQTGEIGYMVARLRARGPGPNPDFPNNHRVQKPARLL